MKPYPDNPKYAVTEDGRVFRIAGGPGTKGPVPYEIVPYVSVHGYHWIGLRYDGVLVRKSVSRLVAETYLPNPEGKAHVAHNDGSRLNNHVSNLRWATPSENEADKIQHGTTPCGIKHPKHKLTDAAVRELRRLTAETSLSQRALAAQFGVSRNAVRLAVKGRSWRHVD